VTTDGTTHSLTEELRRHDIIARPAVARLGTVGLRHCDNDLWAMAEQSEDSQHDENGSDGALLTDKDGGGVRTGFSQNRGLLYRQLSDAMATAQAG
jgi:hypothetical protein